MHYRSIFLSDIHLGTRGSAVIELLEFLKQNDADTIYLLGDIIDIWRLSVRFYWPQTHNDVVQQLLRKAHNGTRIVYVPGNHDEVLRDFCGLSFGGIEIERQTVHITADGRRLWLLHGDEFDYVTNYYHWIAVLGDRGYTFGLMLNRWINNIRCRCGYNQWSLAAFVKRSVKEAVKIISDYEEALQADCKRQGFDGVICGHIHASEIKDMNGILYGNCGDVVESCTALVEDYDGNIMLVELRNHGLPSQVYCRDGQILAGKQCLSWFAQQQGAKYPQSDCEPTLICLDRPSRASN